MHGEGVGVEDSGGGFGAAAGRLHHRLTDGPPTRGRRILVWGLVALAMLLVVVCSLTIWVQRQALNTDNWVDLSTELLADDEVRGAIALRLVDSLYDQNDVQQELETRLPPPLDRLAAPAAGLVRQAAVDAADNLLERPRVQELWASANRAAHERLVAILREDSDRLIQSTDGQVVLDLNPLVVRLNEQLGLNVSLPEGAGTYVIAESDQLAAAQTAVAVIDPLSVFMIIAVVVLLAIAVYLAAGFRRKALRTIALALVAIGVVLLVVRRLAGNALVEDLTTDTNRDVGWTVWILGTNLLRDIAIALLVYGLVLLLGVWLAGPSRWATWVRAKLAPVMRDQPLLVYGVVALVFLLVLLWSPLNSDRGIWGTLLLAFLVGLGVWAFRRQTVKEFPPPST
jgi:hypothetical protein